MVWHRVCSYSIYFQGQSWNAIIRVILYDWINFNRWGIECCSSHWYTWRPRTMLLKSQWQHFKMPQCKQTCSKTLLSFYIWHTVNNKKSAGNRGSHHSVQLLLYVFPQIYLKLKNINLSNFSVWNKWCSFPLQRSKTVLLRLKSLVWTMLKNLKVCSQALWSRFRL